MKNFLHTILVFCLLFPLSDISNQDINQSFVHRDLTDTNTEVLSLSEEINANWWGSAQENINQSEYYISQINDGDETVFQAPNRAHNLRIKFIDDGFHVTPRTDPTAWGWGLRLTAYGYANNPQPVTKSVLQVEKNQITYHRETLNEWYSNDFNGLEQGFTLLLPPPGNLDDEIVLKMDLFGTLNPRLDETGLTLLSNDGVTVMKFGQLYAFDSNNTVLPTRMVLRDAALHIIVGVEDATYPITIDPLAISASWTVESNDAGAQLGYGVASTGDVNGDGYSDVIISAPYFDGGNTNEGRVFVFHGSSSGLSATADWTADGDQDGANFGYSVASAGDFNGDGYADVLIGANSYDNSPADEGAAFIWFGSASGVNGGVTGIPSNANWSVESNLANSNFGFSVAPAGDVNGDGYADVIIGAPGYTDNPGSEDGEGWAFVYHGGGTPDNTSDWSNDSDQANAALGHSVASAGDINGDGYADIMVGAYLYDNGIYTDDGSAYSWLGSSGGLSSSPDWTATGGQDNANFGVSVASAGDVNGDGYSDLIVGASGFTDTVSGEGRASVYHGGGTPDTTADWTADSEQGSAAFGIAVASAGDVNGDGYADVVVGANLYTNGNTGEGAAFTWFGSSTGVNGGVAGVPTNADWSIEGQQDDAFLGDDVASAGDVNGDGYSDIVIGEPGYDDTAPTLDEGQTHVFYGGSYSLSGNITQAAWTYEPNVADSWLGSAAASAGDINGDGYDDLIVGAFLYDRGTYTDEGAAFVFYGSADGPDPNPDWIAYGDQASADNVGDFGETVNTAGDVNGDGYSDVIIGAYVHDNDQVDEGMVFVWYGSASGLPCTGDPCTTLSSDADWHAEGNQTGSQFGVFAKTAGDVNGDGYDDIVIGARNYDGDSVTNAGAVFAWYGSMSGLGDNGTPDNADWSAQSDQTYAQFGNEAASAGDVNGDGYDDLIIGAPRYFNDGETYEGHAFVWYGSAHGINNGINGTPDNAIWSAQGNQAGNQVDSNPVGAFFGYTVGTAGDVNGDGYDDVFIGARYYDNGSIDEGAAFVWHGSASGVNGGTNGFPGNESWRAEIDQENAEFTYANCGAAGDVNGDGFDDVIMGAHQYASEGGQLNEGAVALWLGSANGLNNNENGTQSNANWWLESNNSGDYLGLVAINAGDVNGDGYSDVIIGSPRYSNEHTVEGRTYLYYGNASDGINILPRQRRADDTVDIIPGGQSISPDSVRLSLWAHSPLGRSNVRLQWEIKPTGTAFDGTGVGQTAWSDSTVAGTTINSLINALTFETRFNWRVRLQAQPLNAYDADLVTYQGPWIEGGSFFTALSGEQSISGTGTTNLLGQSAYVNVTTLGSLTDLSLRGYPDTAHPEEDFNGGGANFLDRYFNIDPNVGAAGYNAELCLNYEDSEVPVGFTEDQLRLCRWTGTSWECLSRTLNSNTGNNLVCAANVIAFSDWAIAANVGPTAVEVQIFKAASNSSQLLIPIFGAGLWLLALIWLWVKRQLH